MSRFQCAIVCHQQTKLAELLKIDLAKTLVFSAKLYSAVVIFAIIEKNWDSAPLDAAHFPLQIQCCALRVKGLILLFGLT